VRGKIVFDRPDRSAKGTAYCLQDWYHDLVPPDDHRVPVTAELAAAQLLAGVPTSLAAAAAAAADGSSYAPEAGSALDMLQQLMAGSKLPAGPKLPDHITEADLSLVPGAGL